MRLALLLIDLDGLKEVHETLGHYEARGREWLYVANAGAAVDRACPLAGLAMSVPPASGATGRRGSADRPRVAVGRDDKRELRTGRGTRWQLRFEPAEQEPTSGWDLIARVQRVIDPAPARRPKQPCRRSWLPSRARRESDTSRPHWPASAPLLLSMARSGEESPEQRRCSPPG